jgi:hypothetical protein
MGIKKAFKKNYKQKKVLKSLFNKKTPDLVYLLQIQHINPSFPVSPSYYMSVNCSLSLPEGLFSLGLPL